MQDDGGVYDVLKFNMLQQDMNLVQKLKGLNIPIKGDSYTQSQSQAQPQSQPAQAPPPTQPESVNPNLGNLLKNLECFMKA